MRLIFLITALDSWFVVATTFTRKHCKQSDHTCTAQVHLQPKYLRFFTDSQAYLGQVRHRYGTEVIKDSTAIAKQGLQLIASVKGKFCSS